MPFRNVNILYRILQEHTSIYYILFSLPHLLQMSHFFIEHKILVKQTAFR